MAILSIESPKDIIPKLSELINNFVKVIEFTINIQKSFSFLYTTNKLTEKEIKKVIPFIITLKRIKYLGKNLTKEVKDLYLENYNTDEKS